MADEPLSDDKPSLELDRDDIQRLKEVMRPDPDWISFSSTEARWINFNPQMRAVFGRSRSCRCDETAVNAWIDEAMSVLFHWISKQIIATDARAALFRSLGRGWIWIQLSSSGGREDKSKLPEEQRTRFKWWFENLSRVLRNRQHDIDKLKLKGDMLKKYTTGYMPMSELVFLIYGIAPAMPIIGIQKWSPHYKEVDRWARDDLVRKAVEKPIASEAERQEYAAHVEQQKTRKQRQRAKQKMKKQQLQDEDLLQDSSPKLPGPARMEQSNTEFESLLASLKREAGLAPDDFSPDDGSPIDLSPGAENLLEDAGYAAISAHAKEAKAVKAKKAEKAGVKEKREDAKDADDDEFLDCLSDDGQFRPRDVVAAWVCAAEKPSWNKGHGREAKHPSWLLCRQVPMAAMTSVLPSASNTARSQEGKTAKLQACRLRLPQFEWYLGPMYRRYAEIMAERERANMTQFVKKKVTPTVPDEPAYIKHITSRTPVYAFNEAVHDRPLTDMGKAYVTMMPARRKEQAKNATDPKSATR
ncbi:unnamed protein product [Symbiodinium sp. CCMP2456]|nr:unnamed protein product [Symbiodinium sp. CCMP2456]